VLRSISSSDLDAYHTLFTTTATTAVIERRSQASWGDSKGRLNRTLARQAAGELMIWAITDGADRPMLGFVGLCRFDRPHRRAEVCYELRPEYWGKGLVTEAIIRLVCHAFDQLGLHRIEGHTDPNNLKSVRVLERTGFVREGLLRENYLFDGVFYDTAIYGLLATAERDAQGSP
jgi:ribosomal-protein-alanine N-acetyltransferase